MKANLSRECSPLVRNSLIACLVLLFCIFSTRASLQFDVFPGYDRMVPEGNWFPVVCEIHNAGPTFDAVFEISTSHFGQSHVTRIPIELPTNTRKRVAVPMFHAAGMVSWDFRLLDDRGRVRAQETGFRPRRQVGWEMPIVGALSRTASGAPVMPQAMVRHAELQPAVARLLPAIFPDHPIALEGLQILYLNSQRALDLTVAQAGAIRLWVHQGGHLIVGIEEISDISGNAWLRDLIPYEPVSSILVHPGDHFEAWLRTPRKPDPLEAFVFPAGTRTQDAPRPWPDPDTDPNFQQADLLVALGNLREGRVILAAQQTPLIVEAARGRGRVTVLTFSPEREPFLSWEHRPRFWAQIAGIPDAIFQREHINRLGGRGTDGAVGAMIDSKQIRKLPLGWLLLLLAGYLVVIGPLDYYWLKKSNRQMLTWITFPCYVALFSGLIYLIGYKLRAGETEWNELHVVDVIPTEQQAILRGRTYVSIYSPANARYPMISQQPFAALRGEFGGTWGGGGATGGRLGVTQRGNAFDAEVFVPVWTSQLFVTDWLQPGAVPAALHVTQAGSQWIVTVQNHLDRALGPVYVVVDGRLCEIGTLPARETRTVTLGTNDGTKLSDFGRQHGHTLFHAVERRQQAFGDSRAVHLGDMTLNSIALSFALHLNQDQQSHRRFASTDRLDLSPFVSRPDTVILLAWDSGQSPITDLNQFSPHHSRQDTLLRMVVRVAATD